MSDRTCAFPVCGRPRVAKGLCVTHRQHERAGIPLAPIAPRRRKLTEQQRFFAKVSTDGDCWVWTANRTERGYGKFQGVRGETYAHRWAFEFFLAEIPEGLVLDHLCRNHSCVNPWHLEPVTQRVNVLRGDGTTHGLTPPRITAKRRAWPASNICKET